MTKLTYEMFHELLPGRISISFANSLFIRLIFFKFSSFISVKNFQISCTLWGHFGQIVNWSASWFTAHCASEHARCQVDAMTNVTTKSAIHSALNIQATKDRRQNNFSHMDRRFLIYTAHGRRPQEGVRKLGICYSFTLLDPGSISATVSSSRGKRTQTDLFRTGWVNLILGVKPNFRKISLMSRQSHQNCQHPDAKCL